MNAGEGNPLGCACGIRGPKPYDEREVPSITVARGPVPRDRHHYEVRLRSFRTYMSIEKRVPFQGPLGP